MIPENIVSVVAVTSTGEIHNIPLNDFLSGVASSSKSTVKDSVLKGSNGKIIGTSINEDDSGQVSFRNYTSGNSFCF